MLNKNDFTLERGLFALLRSHFRTDPWKLPVVVETVEPFQRPNLHLTIEELLAAVDPPPGLVGMVTPDHTHGPSLSKLSRPASAAPFEEGPVEYLDVPLADDCRLTCVKQGLYLFKADGHPIALLVSEPPFFRPGGEIRAEVMAADRE